MSEQGPPTRRLIHLPRVRMLGRSRQSNVRITNVKSIRPPDPEVVKKQEEEKLRAQLKKEIENRSRTCSHKTFECNLPVVSGAEYCARHLAEDPAYKQCAYISNGMKCDMPAPADSKKETSLCFEHARLSQLHRQRASAPPPPVTTAEGLLARLAHYVRPERVRTESCASSVSVVSDPGDGDAPQLTVDPFKQLNAPAINASVSSAIMECGSGTDSDADSVTLGRGADVVAEGGSEDEDVDYDWHPLRHAGIFTAEEAVREARLAHHQLQAAYLRQAGRLHAQLKAARRRYLKALKAEREQYCSINSQARNGPLSMVERRQLRALKAFASYHRRLGGDAVLARKAHRKRAKGSEPSRPGPPPPRCQWGGGGVRCPRAALPAARHCPEHLLDDPRQVLFTRCAGPSCRLAVPRAPLGPLCVYHHTPPSYTPFTLKKDNSDTDSDTNSASEMSNHTDAGETETLPVMGD